MTAQCTIAVAECSDLPQPGCITVAAEHRFVQILSYAAGLAKVLYMGGFVQNFAPRGMISLR